MSAEDQFRFSWSNAGREKVSGDWQIISKRDFLEVPDPIQSIAEPGGAAPLPWAQDLLTMTRAIYAADKKALRKGGPDGWTRKISLSISLCEPDRWTTTAKQHLSELLETLTSDRWEVELRSGGYGLPTQGRLDEWQASDISLFSGGLDSTALAADLGHRTGSNVLFVMFFDPSMKDRQREIFNLVDTLGPRTLRHWQLSQTVLGHGRSLEQSSRTRGLLYMAAAIYAASAHELRTISVPENGHLAINPPLSPSRPVACSTRSVHPRTLGLLNQLVADVGGNVKVENPLKNLTKGEVCRLALDAGLTQDDLFRTVSCSHPPIKRSRSTSYNCGHCYACLIRRAGLWSALRADRTEYEVDPWNLPYKHNRANDLRALQYWLSTPLTSRDLIRDVPLPDGVTPASVMPVLRRTRTEASAMLDALVPQRSDFRANWQPCP